MVRSVKAAVMVAPGRMEVREFPYPTLGEGAIILRMEMAGICGTDKHTYRGENVQYAGTPAESRTPFPIIPGHENVGVIEEIDRAARERGDFYGRELREGDRVTFCPDLVCGRCWYCRNTFGYPWCENVRGYGNSLSCDAPPHLFGGWAEYVYLLPGVFVYRVPEGMPPEVAVLAELFTVSCALDRALTTCLPGDGFSGAPTVVIQGVGPLGLCCLIKARILGASQIIVTDLSPFRLRMAEEFGADGALNVAETELGERVEFVRERTQGRGADIVIECAGVPEVLPEGLEMLRKGGLYLELGNFVDTGEVSINVHRLLCAKNVHLVGVTNHPFTGYGPSLELMRRYGHLYPFERIITHRYPLEEAEEALLRSMEPDTMKVVITP